MKVDRKAVALDAIELDEKKEKEIDDNKVLKISTFRGVSSDSSSTDNEGKKKSDMSNSTLSSLQEIQQQHHVGRSLTQKITKTHHHLEAAKLSKHEALLNHNTHYNHRSAARAACRASR